MNNYATNNVLDLALSDISPSDTISTIYKGPGAPFYHFSVTDAEQKAFLKLALSGPSPRDAAGYRGYLEGKYSDVVQASITYGYEANWTKPMGALLATTQGIINDQRLTDAQKIDAANTSHLVLFNILTGAMGNAPLDGKLPGWSQAGIGLVAPLGGNLPHDGSYFDHVFDTSHPNDALETNSADNNVQLHHMQAVVTQGALNSGLLKPEMLDPGIVVNGKIVEGAQFDTWYEIRGNLLSLGPPAPPGTDPEHYKVPSLDDYVDAVLNPLELHR